MLLKESQLFDQLTLLKDQTALSDDIFGPDALAGKMLQLGELGIGGAILRAQRSQSSQ